MLIKKVGNAMSANLVISMMSLDDNVSNAQMKLPSLLLVMRKEKPFLVKLDSNSHLLVLVVLTELTIVGSLILPMESFVINASLDMEDLLITELV